MAYRRKRHAWRYKSAVENGDHRTGENGRAKNRPVRQEVSIAPEEVLAHRKLRRLLRRDLSLPGNIRMDDVVNKPDWRSIKMHWPGLTIVLRVRVYQKKVHYEGPNAPAHTRTEPRIAITVISGTLRPPSNWYAEAQQDYAERWLKRVWERAGLRTGSKVEGFEADWTPPPPSKNRPGVLTFKIFGEPLARLKGN